MAGRVNAGASSIQARGARPANDGLRTRRLIYVNARLPQGGDSAGMIQERPKPTMICPHCGKPMRLAQVIPALGALPELLTFECKPCAEVITEAKDDLPELATA